MRIFLDLDGVICNFADAAIRLCGHDPVEVWSSLPPGKEGSYDFFKSWGMTTANFYGTIETEGKGFWAHLGIYPGSLELFELCQSLAETMIVTKPTRDPHSAAGKMEWMQRHFGDDFDHFFIGKYKHLLATPDSLLIDDSNDNVEAFGVAGGNALLVPRRWNFRWREEANSMELVKEGVKAMARVLK